MPWLAAHSKVLYTNPHGNHPHKAPSNNARGTLDTGSKRDATGWICRHSPRPSASMRVSPLHQPARYNPMAINSSAATTRSASAAGLLATAQPARPSSRPAQA
ncbi:hypothetical protein D3C79_983070 [compost metagenome]